MNKHRLHTCLPAGRDFKKQITRIIILSIIYCLLITLMGCDAFVRKFTRKPKKDKLRSEEIILEPEEYKGPQMSKEELYRQYFLYWKSWHTELIQALSQKSNHKKQIYCIDETLKNLEQLNSLLNEEKKKALDIYINQLKDLRDLIKKDLYGGSIARNRRTAERIKRDIHRNFSYSKIKDYLFR